MTEAETNVLVRLLAERTSLVAAGAMGIRSAIELMQERGYTIQPPKCSGCPLHDQPERK